MNDPNAADPRDEEIAALKQQLAERDAADVGAGDVTRTPTYSEVERGESNAPTETTEGATVSGDDIIADAKARLEAGEGLDAEHVRAIEHPEEFAGKQLPVPDVTPTA